MFFFILHKTRDVYISSCFPTSIKRTKTKTFSCMKNSHQSMLLLSDPKKKRRIGFNADGNPSRTEKPRRQIINNRSQE